MSYLSFSKRWAGYLSRKTRLTAEQEIILAYVLEVLALNFLNISFTLLLGALLGVLPGTIACLATTILFRHSAGGAHSNSPWRCATVTIAVFPLLALLGAYFSGLGQMFVDILTAIAFGVGINAMLLLAPVDSPAAPIISPLRRAKLKKISVLFVVLATVMAIWLRNTPWPYTETAQPCIALTLFWSSFMLTPWGHKLMSLVDSISLKTKPKEV
ncbi:accessory gene regulator ArgB-like protein [Desulfallas thermosapovorans]|uniref:Accessory gene regulator B n=1 Tax=Desulfallas thermosapovorans DSM 6562 TaxID=1121431 RepID=A0A5S4ZUW2_9FIRM|nr:accessory gene regulator B family protein [Desulfallas thermosapovorans]TYO96495.1 accessory gene regulator B [Desulfallas thermosapovorans DSM 6562]